MTTALRATPPPESVKTRISQPKTSANDGCAIGYCSRAAALIISPRRQIMRPFPGTNSSPTDEASTIAYTMPPYARSTETTPISGTCGHHSASLWHSWNEWRAHLGRRHPRSAICSPAACRRFYRVGNIYDRQSNLAWRYRHVLPLEASSRQPGTESDPESGLANPNRTANVSGPILGCVEADFLQVKIKSYIFRMFQDL